MSGVKLSAAEKGVVREVFDQAQVGYLGVLTAEGYPRVVPLSFAAEENTVFFHGAGHGEKNTALKGSPRVTFSANITYSTIPSFWMMEGIACPATVLFKSVQIDGQGQIVEDLDEKALALQRVMEKYQPQGGFLAITAANPIYEQLLGVVQVYRVQAERVTVRAKFAQNHPETVRNELIAKLEERNEGMDLETAEEIRKTLEA